MTTFTTAYNLGKPAPNDPSDANTWGPTLNSNFDKIDTALTGLAATSKMPIGSLYFNAGDSTNPASLLGYGTWTSFGAGRVLLGTGSTADDVGETRSYALGAVGGSFTHTLTTAQMPSHTHSLAASTQTTTQAGTAAKNGPATTGTLTTTSAGGDQSHNNIQPYIVVNIWQRVA